MEAQNSPLSEIAARLAAARRVLALCHVAPDGDAIGALLGLHWVLARLPNPPHLVLACADDLPPELSFLPGSDRISADPPPTGWDAVVCLDASDPARLGDIFRPAAFAPAPILVVDHHITNRFFGTINHVDTTAAATSQIIVGLADALAVPISQDAALCLLTGIVTDTLAFRTTNTTAAVLAVATRLVAAGADLARVTDLALNRQPLSAMRLWGLALNQLRLEQGVLWVGVTRTMRQQAGVPGTDDGGLVSQLINADEAQVAAVFRELEGRRVEISIRSRKGIDVASVALALGGGGHPQAAGCTIGGTLEEAQARVIPLLQQAARPSS